MDNKNIFAIRYPELAAQWHPTKNEDLRPQMVAPMSNKKVWWQCDKGHEWQATVNNRVAKGSGCPYCSGLRVIAGETDLSTKYPDIAAEWHPSKNWKLTPQMVSPGTNRKVWWLGKCGHEWEAPVASRSSGNKCPICSGRKLLVGFNDLATVRPELAAEWHPTRNGELTPQDFVQFSNKKVWWQCSYGHEWQSSIGNRAGLGRGCPVCSNERQTSFPEQAILYYLRKYTSAESRYTEQGKEIDVYLPELRIGIEYNGRRYHQDKAKDAQKVAFFAEKNIIIYSVNEGERNQIKDNTIEYCYSASNKDALTWALYALFDFLPFPAPDIDLAADSSQIYEQYVYSEKENSFAAKYPEIAAEWHPTKNGKLTPDKVSYRSGKKVWWICDKGHEWQATPYNRSNGDGCACCSGRKVIPGETDLGTLYPELATQWHPTKNGDLTPRNVRPGSEKKVWWICEKGHEWQATINSRAKVNGAGCACCSGKRVIPGETDLMTVNPALAAEWHPTKNGDLLPGAVTRSSDKKVWWLGKCGHEWQAAVKDRSRGTGCPYCSGRKRE